MHRLFLHSLRFALTLAALTFPALPVRADTWSEAGDAGSLPNVAQDVSGFSNLTEIQGAVSWTGSDSADLYRIFISDPAAFSATTVGTPGTLADTFLFLLHADGTPVYANEDEDFDAGEIRSTLPAGHPFSPTTPGFYFLGITGTPTAPTSDDDFLFCGCSGDVMGPNSSFPDAPITNYFDFIPADEGTYTIVLTGVEAASTPEPGTFALFSLGLLGVGGSTWRKRKRRARIAAGSPPAPGD